MEVNRQDWDGPDDAVCSPYMEVSRECHTACDVDQPLHARGGEAGDHFRVIPCKSSPYVEVKLSMAM